MKRLVLFLCSLFMLAQGLASVAFAAPLSMSAAKASMMDIEHCTMHMEKKAGAPLKCCGEHCSDMANCFSTLAALFVPSLAVAQPAAVAPTAHRPGGFTVPDPDLRLRPPTSLLG